MIKKIFALVVLSFIVSGVEIYYINSSPLLGYGNLEDLKANKEKLKYLNISKYHFYEVYEGLYEVRPHINDVLTKDLYKFHVLGFGFLEIMRDGIILWQLGIFGNVYNLSMNETYEWVKTYAHYRPIAVASGSDLFLDSDADVLSDINMMEYVPLKEDEYGKRLATLIPIGWFVIVDSTIGNSVVLFENNLSKRLNVSHEEFLKGYVELYRVILARLSFIESVLDEKPPWKGILYLAYYPYFKKIWIVIKSIPKKEIENCRILIDSVEYEKIDMYPFIFVDAEVSDGNHNNHKLDLITESKTYTLNFNVDISPILLKYGTLYQNGTYSALLMNVNHLNHTILVRDITVSIEGVQKIQEINEIVTQYNATSVHINLDKTFKEGEWYTANVTIRYVVEGREKKYLKKMFIRAGY